MDKNTFLAIAFSENDIVSGMDNRSSSLLAHFLFLAANYHGGFAVVAL